MNRPSEPEDKAIASAAHAAPVGVATLLVVDDSVVQRRHAIALAKQLGVQTVHEAANGIEALALLGTLQRRPDLLVIDLEMPTMDGVELIQQLRARHLDAPFIVVSSREGALVNAVEEMAHSLGLPVVGGLCKPLTAAALQAAMAACQPLQQQAADKPRRAAPTLSLGDLDEALAQHTLVPHYQPKVDVRSGLIRGVEVLARWPHAQHGMVPPDQFIALAEQHDRIRPLTLSILAQALGQAARWNARGLRLSVAVNLSPLLLDSPSLVDDLDRLMQQHGLDADQMVLEITEGTLIDPRGAALGVLARLRMKGFGLSIDDYGTGFSSMQQLTRVSFTELKVDRSFVHGAHRNESRRVILESALKMAHRLRLTTVAEGVETMDDWRLLQRFGCNVCQGFLIARPMPGEDLHGWLRQHKHRLTELRAPAPLNPDFPT
jgi:EAL domain-containing protein (putative c-di-GMP-specific phosphodiesterase class I)/FixJ family two-component response regulator